MISKLFSSTSVFFLIAFFAAFSYNVHAQIPNQLAEDFVAGKAPSPEVVAQCEKEAAEKPYDLRVVRDELAQPCARLAVLLEFVDRLGDGK